MKNSYLKIFWINLICLILFVLDRLTKKLILIYSPTNFLDLINFFPNPDIAFSISIPENLFIYFLVLLFLILIFLFCFLFISYQQKKYLNILTITLIIFGAISNLIDRFLYGYIIDFIDLGLGNVFNLSDVYITSGVIILTLSSLKKPK